MKGRDKSEMDASEYRRQYAEELNKAARRRSGFRELLESKSAAERVASLRTEDIDDVDDATLALEVLHDRETDLQLRIAAIRVVGANVRRRPELIDRLLELLRDESETPELRRVTLGALQQTTFLARLFAQKRPDYMVALRSIVDDQDVELRRRAVGILAREKDEYVQRRLLEGLENRSKALVPAAKAIQFLGYDVHAEYFPILRRIVEHPPNRAAKREAVRLLAADPGSTDVLAELLADKAETTETRNASAVALQSLAPDRFDAIAKRIAFDDEEDDRLRATFINALTHFADPATHAEDGEFAASVERLESKSASPQVRRAARNYLARVRG